MNTHMHYLIDTHCHIGGEEFESDRPDVVNRAIDAGVSQMIAIGPGWGFEGNLSAIQLAEEHPGVFASVGIHPHEAASYSEKLISQLQALTTHPKVVAIGECGLDYFYSEPPKAAQLEAFEAMINLAHACQKPLIIHCRNAGLDVFEKLENSKALLHGGVMHCFSGDIAAAKRTFDLGYYISIPGIVTFNKRNEILVEVVKWAPLDRMLIETDAPFLAPVPHRGKRNEPAFVVEVAKKIAELKEVSLEEVAKATTENAKRLFKLVSW